MTIPRGIKKLIDFWIDFLSILAPFWDPLGHPRAANEATKTSFYLDGSMVFYHNPSFYLDGSDFLYVNFALGAQMAPIWPPDPPKRAPGTNFHRFVIDFG